MNLKIFFIPICVLQLVDCSASTGFNSLPIELHKRIMHYVLPSSEDLPVVKFNQSQDSEIYHYTRLFFPSTNSLQFVNLKTENEFVYKTNPQKIVAQSYVVPSIQCCLQDIVVWVNDVLAEKSYCKGFRLGDKVEKILFDLKGEKLVYCAAKSTVCIIFRYDLSDASYDFYRASREAITLKNNKKPLDILSLCFHTGDRDEFSLTSLDCSGGANKELLLFNFEDGALNKRIPLPHSMTKIKRHEYIGNGTFLLLDEADLFFVQIDGNQTFFSKQKILIDQVSKKEYSVVSFCVNQSDNKKTQGDRARYFFILAKTETEGNRLVQVLFCVDLLDHYNTLTRIWSVEIDKNEAFDRIAYDNGVFSLWNDSIDNTAAMIIRLPLDWLSIVNKKLLFQEYYQDPDFLENRNKLLLFKEDKKNDPVKTKYLFLRKYRFFLVLFVACFVVYCGMKMVQKSSAFLS